MIEPSNSGRVALLTRIAGVCGITSQLVGLVVVLIAIYSSSWFSWTENDVSVLGVEGSATTLFNSGLILIGVLSLIFAIGLWRSFLSSRLGRLGASSLILGSLAISATGVFPRTIDLPHDLSSIAFFVFIALALLLIGSAAITAAQIRWGVPSLTAGALIIIFQLVPWPWSGGAISQSLSCLPWSLWTIAFGVRLLVRPGPLNV
jgi:hypothetical membrane protein